MCGICGVIRLREGPPIAAAAAAAMASVIAHRGPDDAGVYTDGTVALGHRRLSIVDLAGGHQPMANEDGSIWIVFNGEIFNHRDLRAALIRRGHRYTTASDTETILHLYEEEGEACVERLRGMFAFALWDAPRQRLFLARDRLGIKPLYYHQDADRFRFASEIKALLADPEVEARLNWGKLSEHLAFRYLTGDETLFDGVRKLPPGHTLTIASAPSGAGVRVTMRQYWDVPGPPSGAALGAWRLALGESRPVPTKRQAPSAKRRSEAELVAQFRALFEEAVRLRLMSDVPLGMFLSGGIDSAAIAAVMSGLMDRPLKTFSIGFAEEGYHEFDYAREVARLFRTEHHEAVLDAEGFRESLPRAIWHHDEPICFPAAVPLLHLAELAGRSVKVVLTGEGSDELLAGYGRTAASYWNTRWGTAWRRWCPEPVRARWVPELLSRLPAGGRWGRWARRSFLMRPPTLRALHWESFYTAFTPEAQSELLLPPIDASHADPYRAAEGMFESAAPRGLLDRLLYADLKGYLVELLMKQDKMSMAASIESRVPFLDHPLVEFCAAVPPSLKLRGMTGKYLLRRAMRDRLPARILRRPKLGFPVPLAGWLRGPWRDFAHDLLLDDTARQRGLYNPAVVGRLLEAHDDGRSDASDRIWTLLNLELWHRTFLDSARRSALGARSGQKLKSPSLPLSEPSAERRAPSAGAQRP
jgi:asparagine synthase (glutamine-hydrolysing)